MAIEIDEINPDELVENYSWVNGLGWVTTLAHPDDAGETIGWYYIPGLSLWSAVETRRPYLDFMLCWKLMHSRAVRRGTLAH